MFWHGCGQMWWSIIVIWVSKFISSQFKQISQRHSPRFQKEIIQLGLAWASYLFLDQCMWSWGQILWYKQDCHSPGSQRRGSGVEDISRGQIAQNLSVIIFLFIFSVLFLIRERVYLVVKNMSLGSDRPWFESQPCRLLAVRIRFFLCTIEVIKSVSWGCWEEENICDTSYMLSK